ncbi:type II toxin-antitoxin system HicB family antitoxin [Chamaesiphon sp. GL140_3_metabinner_50]|uniref:type II toxin-antitoxin system HicB family antitoxin n=1 Tax=Chamaesiphon sp. GL140_3_metabinner_50 TaxID=2970812 RepID=UPI0025F16654|nr:type II toxin-antitoxin system HicB family antitoxin [Chamaesiphon sp. GL140_3_metabinner_50]
MKPKIQQQMMSREPLEYYLSLTYSVTLDPDPEGGYVAHIKDLSGCFTQGETLAETMANIQEARELWIETAYEMGDPIPLPNNLVEYSGKLLIRMPKSLHRDLAHKAEVEAVSLNQYISSVLSRSLS